MTPEQRTKLWELTRGRPLTREDWETSEYWWVMTWHVSHVHGEGKYGPHGPFLVRRFDGGVAEATIKLPDHMVYVFGSKTVEMEETRLVRIPAEHIWAKKPAPIFVPVAPNVPMEFHSDPWPPEAPEEVRNAS